MDAIEATRATGLRSTSVLEIGSGVGELARELARRGARPVTGLDLSAESVAIARRETAAEGLGDTVRFGVGNGAIEPLEAHDVVVLERVICCYPRPEELIAHTSAAAGRVFAFTVPRNEGAHRFLWRAAFWIGNTYHALRRRDFRAYLHDLDSIDRWLEDEGLVPTQRFSRRGWLHAVYVRGA